MIAWEIIFWLCMAGLLHSYLLFPLMMRLLNQGKPAARPVWDRTESPEVTVIIPAYNEERFIREKLLSVFGSDYPAGKIRVVVGSDNSTDATNSIVEELKQQFPLLELNAFGERMGKTGILNRLVPEAKSGIVILSDANVIFDRDTVYKLVMHFRDGKTGLVDSNMINRIEGKQGIARQEKTYIDAEVGTKNAEGNVWGCMMGPFGGCYAMRKELFSPIPSNFLVDDFYINMKVLQQGYRCINERDSKVYEEANPSLSEEFRRKVRIATGNWQNLVSFFPLLFRFDAVSFCFLSHKVLRWKGPFLMILALISLLFLAGPGLFPPLNSAGIYHWILWAGLGTVLLPLLELLGIRLVFTRYLLHFYTMNLALFIGFFRFVGGVKSSAWRPVRREK